MHRAVKNSKVISTSGNLAATLDFWHTSTSYEIGSTTIRKLDLENIGVAVGILSLCALELKNPPPYRAGITPANVAKTVAERRVKTPSIRKVCTAMTTVADIIYMESAKRQLPTAQTRTNCETTDSRAGNRTSLPLLTYVTFTIVLG